MGSRSEIVDELREVLTLIESDGQDIERKSDAAFQRVADFFTWEKKAAQVSRVYEWIAAGRNGGLAMGFED